MSRPGSRHRGPPCRSQLHGDRPRKRGSPQCGTPAFRHCLPVAPDDGGTATWIAPSSVDVEAVRNAPGAETVLAPVELAALRSVHMREHRAGFARAWVRKEAALMATGPGLRIPTDRLESDTPHLCLSYTPELTMAT
ncbi:4'-phosphopantetheinyl transferase superfamily protein [Nonomuraea sp. NPDC005983]|uniref:4'-phosphopantetheinyl transferase superfamily protein n=1 Tax=Nonomuraea sp. NPDC005983 TaxID=3155595 RepID=UPI0033BDA7CE